jgi:hypothetical protein
MEQQNAVIGAPASDSDSRDARMAEALTSVCSRLETLANEQVGLKVNIEARWIEDLRNYHGLYDNTTEAALRLARKSRAFVKITRKKTNAWAARLEDLIYPTDDRNWGIQPTPVPRLAKDAAQAAQQAKAKVAAANQQMPADPSADPQAAAQAQATAAEGQAHADTAASIAGVIDEAKKRCDAMQEVMDDQLTECSYAAIGRDIIRDGCRLGTGIIKGPLVGEQARGTWGQQDTTHPETGAPMKEWGYTKSKDPSPVYVRVSPWDYFPDMSASKPNECEFEFQRHLWTKRDLRAKVREFGFNADAVRRLISDETVPPTPVGLSYLSELRGITGDSQALKGRYVGWEYHGPLEIREIASIMRAMAGDEDARLAADQYEANADPLDERRVIIHFCNGEVLKFSPDYLLDSCESLFNVFVFEEAEWSIFGYGVPRIMNDSQRAVNGGWRMALDNAALSVGPQIIIDKAGITPEDGSYDITARKVWLLTKAAVPGQQQPFQAVDIPQNITEILEIVREARAHADDETALPVVSEGEMPEGPQQTATADRARAVGSNVVFRRVVKAFDDGITVPGMRKLYDWNMQFNPREDIKGDMSVDARGASALLAKEQAAANLLGIATTWTTHPVLGMMVKPYDAACAALKAQAISVDDILRPEDEYDQAVANAAKNPPPDPAVIVAQAQKERAQIDATSREKVATINMNTALATVAQQHNMKIDELKAMLFETEMQLKSKERIFAGEVGAERQMAQEAHAHGLEMAGSGGYISGGEKPIDKANDV